MNTETKIASYNVEIFDQIFKLNNPIGDTVPDLANRNTDFTDFDEQTEKAEEQQAMIDSRISDIWKDGGEICQVIADNFDEFANINAEAYDVAAEIEKAIDGFFKTMVLDELNL